MSTSRLHHIQRQIIASLAHTSPLRFSQLQPRHIPNNTFSYHLKRLLETGYIAAHKDGYVITRKAVKLLAYTELAEKPVAPPVVLSVLFVTNAKGEVLLLERATPPFKHYLGTLSGLIHGGEASKTAARRELFEKTGILAEIDALQPHGILDFRYRESDTNDLLIHGIGLIYSYIHTGKPALLESYETKYGRLTWSDLTDPRILPEVLEIAAVVTPNNHMAITSIDYQEPPVIGDAKLPAAKSRATTRAARPHTA